VLAEASFVNSLLEEPDGAVLLGTAGGLYRLRLDKGAARFENIDFGRRKSPKAHPSARCDSIARALSGWAA